MKQTLHLLLLIVVTLLASCQETGQLLAFAEVQNEFNKPQPNHAAIIESLPDSVIAKQPPLLQPTAWMMRGMSEWELKKFHAANSSSIHGIEAKPEPGSREAVMLALLPALVIDSQLDVQWQASQKTLPLENYAQVEEDFLTALAVMKDAQATMGPPTPQSTRSYFHYQRWRLLYRWQQIIFSLATSELEQNRIALDVSRHFGGKNLLQAADADKLAIPAGDEYRQRIEAQSKRP